jgi:hypothetical protein
VRLQHAAAGPNENRPARGRFRVVRESADQSLSLSDELLDDELPLLSDELLDDELLLLSDELLDDELLLLLDELLDDELLLLSEDEFEFELLDEFDELFELEFDDESSSASLSFLAASFFFDLKNTCWGWSPAMLAE